MSANVGFAASLLRCVRLASQAVCSSYFAGGVLDTLRTITMAAAKKCSIPECESVVDNRGTARCKSCNAARSKVQHKIKGLGGKASFTCFLSAFFAAFDFSRIGLCFVLPPNGPAGVSGGIVACRAGRGEGLLITGFIMPAVICLSHRFRKSMFAPWHAHFE